VAVGFVFCWGSPTVGQEEALDIGGDTYLAIVTGLVDINAVETGKGAIRA
jgi:hypothetical protein